MFGGTKEPKPCRVDPGLWIKYRILAYGPRRMYGSRCRRPAASPIGIMNNEPTAGTPRVLSALIARRPKQGSGAEERISWEGGEA